MSDEKPAEAGAAEEANPENIFDEASIEAAVEAAAAEIAAEEAAADVGPDIEAVIAERDALQDRFMRALADLENSRKRSERDRREAERFGGSKLARDLLPVYDNMSRALGSVSDEMRETGAAVIEGVELTMRELLSIFQKHGIERISPEVGDKFDPKLHQAMFEAPVPNTKAGDIIQVAAEGFTLHDRLLRPAQVGVSSNT